MYSLKKPIMTEPLGATRADPGEEDFRSSRNMRLNGNSTSAVVTRVQGLLGQASRHRERTGRPLITLTYAQSLDGSIASLGGKPLRLSSVFSLTMTHALRASHDAILVGIGCVLADNPRLTVRLVCGGNPQPVIVDSRLRVPLSSNLLGNCGPPPWIATTDKADEKKGKALESAGATVIRLKSTPAGAVDLPMLLLSLGERGVNSVMVEGGARIISSFVTSRLIDQVVITIAPILVGGLRVMEGPFPVSPRHFPRLRNMVYERAGEDLILCGNPEWAG